MVQSLSHSKEVIIEETAKLVSVLVWPDHDSVVKVADKGSLIVQELSKHINISAMLAKERYGYHHLCGIQFIK